MNASYFIFSSFSAVFFRNNESDCDFYGINDHKMNFLYVWNMFLLGGLFCHNISLKACRQFVFWCCSYPDKHVNWYDYFFGKHFLRPYRHNDSVQDVSAADDQKEEREKTNEQVQFTFDVKHRKEQTTNVDLRCKMFTIHVNQLVHFLDFLGIKTNEKKNTKQQHENENEIDCVYDCTCLFSFFASS